MGKRGVIILIIGIVVAIVLMYLFYEPSKKEEQKLDPASWEMHYEYNSKDPYGTYIFYELLKQTTFRFKQVEDSPSDIINDYKDRPDKMLLIVCNKTYPDYLLLWQEIDSFIYAGNKALFILEKDPYSLVNYYRDIFTVETKSDSLMSFRFLSHPEDAYEYELLDDYKVQVAEWSYFDLKDKWSAFEYEDSEIPGYSYVPDGDSVYNFYVHEVDKDNRPVFIEVPYGEGSIFIHRAPIAFTNISLLEEKNVEHLERMLGKIDYNGIIYNTPPVIDMPDFSGKERTSPLQFILSNPSLTWAYYIIIGCLVLFVIFNLKRKQNAIPMIPPKANSTLEFVDALSKIYFQKHNNQNLVKHKYRIFNTFIRTRYHIIFIKDQTEYARIISVKSGIELDRIAEIMNKFQQFSKQEVKDEQLFELHKMLDNFYKHCK